MSKTVIHIFHGDDASLSAGSHVAERVLQVAADQSVDLEVFCCGPAQGALISKTGDATSDFNLQIHELIAAGVSVSACLNAAIGAGTEDALRGRGDELQYARDASVRWPKWVRQSLTSETRAIRQLRVPVGYADAPPRGRRSRETHE